MVFRGTMPHSTFRDQVTLRVSHLLISFLLLILCLQFDSTPDGVPIADNEYEVVQSLPESPSSAYAMLTFADIVAASTVKTWSDCADGSCSRCAEPDDSSSSSDGSTATATTVRTVVKSNISRTSDLSIQSNSATEASDVKKPKSTSRSTSRPASARVRQLTTTASSRSRSVSQPRPPLNDAKYSVPTAAGNKSQRLNRQTKQ